jgi:adenine/guanine phosphoribosyltransferase-like PRPP-binding protein
VCVLDDLISTGGTTRAVAELATAAGAAVCCVAAVLLEGEDTVANPTARTNGVPVVWLQAIPQFRSS